MPAKKPWPLVRIDGQGKDLVAVSEAPNGKIVNVPLLSLPRPALIQVAAKVFEGRGAPAKGWLSCTGEELRNAIITDTLPDGGIEKAPEPEPEIEAPMPDLVVPMPEAHHQMLPTVIRAVSAGVNLLMVGPAGSGKSTLAEQTFTCLGKETFAISFGPTTPTSKLFGYMNATGDYVDTPFRRAYENGQGFIADELDNGHPGLTAELNQALANGYGAFADQMVHKHPDARIIATANTFGRGGNRLFVGRNQLDAATLDRFTMIEINYDEKAERKWAMAAGAPAKWVDRVQAVRRQVEKQNLPIVVSPRASIDGGKLLAAGIPWKQVEEMRLFAGIDAETRGKIGG